MFKLTQFHYIAALRILTINRTLEEFCKSRATFAWKLQFRPEYACIVNKAAHITDEKFFKSAVLKLNKAIKSAKKTSDIGLTCKPIEVESSHLRIYVNASYATNHDMSSQMGYIIMLCGDNNNCNILEFSSRKSRRVVQSIMSAELYATSHASDAATLLEADLSRASGKKTPAKLFTDLKQIFNVIARGKLPTEKRLAIDLFAMREAYCRMDIERVGLVKDENNPAHAIIKLLCDGAFGNIHYRTLTSRQSKNGILDLPLTMSQQVINRTR